MTCVAVSHLHLVAAEPRHFGPLVGLLAASRLPSGDIAPAQLADFQVFEDGGDLVGAVGLERYGHVGLLRSLVVAPSFRGYGLGTLLVEAAEARARQCGIRALYLLTTSARAFFEQRGYHLLARERAPRVLQTSSEFSSVCPASAACLYKPLMS